MFNFTGKIFFGRNEITKLLGNDLELLFIHMLSQCQDQPGDLNGSIEDNHSHLLVRKFRKSSSE